MGNKHTLPVKLQMASLYITKQNIVSLLVAQGGQCQEREYSSQVWWSSEEISLSCRQPKSQVFLECRKSVHLKFLLGLALPGGVLYLQPRNTYKSENPAQSLTALPIRSPKTWRKKLLGQKICKLANPDTWSLSFIGMIKSNSQPGTVSCPSSSNSPLE